MELFFWRFQMKKTLILVLIFICFFVLIGCSKDKKTDTTSDMSISSNAVSDNVQSKNRMVIDEKYRGEFIINFGTSDIYNSYWVLELEEDCMKGGLRHIFKETGIVPGDVQEEIGLIGNAWTEGNELMSSESYGEGYRDYKIGTFTDINTLVLVESQFFYYIAAKSTEIDPIYKRKL